MNRRQLMAASLAAAAPFGSAVAQPASTPPAPQPPARAPLPPLAQPSLPMSIVAEGLHFPEGPVALRDGSLLFVQIPAKRVSRLTPAGKVETAAELDGGPNGLAVGPDGKVWIANDGGRFTFVERDGTLVSGPPPAGFTGGGKIQRLDLKSGKVETVFDTIDGKPLIAPDDLVFDRHGGLWVTEFGLARGSGAIYYAAPGAKALTLARGGLNAPNGIGVSPDGKLLHVSLGTSLYAFDIVGPGVLATTTYPGGLQAGLYQGSFADSLKLQADGKVCVCSLFRPGGISVIDRAGHVEFVGFPDRMTCSLAFGGADMRGCWVMLSGTGRIARVRWPSPGQTPAFRA
ncbi:MAG TPA: SMP-30/gluconolactonase/LRE family protein [Phenylobacterium sp.]|jgi:gluconolactonase